MTLPNLIIAGAPKCGTSSIFNWLVDHPEVCGSTTKETFFLMDQEHPLVKPHANFHTHGMGKYAEYFNQCGDSKVVVEATTHYMYQETALDVLSGLTPQPQIMFVLRKPAARVLSSFKFTKNNLANVDKNLSFSSFIKAAQSGSGELAQQIFGSSAEILKNDIKYSQYIDYISRWRARFTPDRLKILLFENMKNDPRNFMQNLAEWIGIEPQFYRDYKFEKKNETYSIRGQFLHRHIRKVALAIPQNIRASLPRDLYYKLQANQEDALTEQDKENLAELERQFEPYNRRLAEETGIDLTPWGRS